MRWRKIDGHVSRSVSASSAKLPRLGSPFGIRSVQPVELADAGDIGVQLWLRIWLPRLPRFAHSDLLPSEGSDPGCPHHRNHPGGVRGRIRGDCGEVLVHRVAGGETDWRR
jgi:hypothetical protein